MFSVAIALILSLLQFPPPPKHLTISATSSATRATSGSRVSLFLDITPKPGIHVYAPGAKDYRPIAVVINPHPGVKIGKVKYPKSGTMLFEGEKVPVYEKPFRLVSEISLDPSMTAASVTLSATVNYQACDDKVCFLPASAVATWTIDVGAGRAGR